MFAKKPSSSPIGKGAAPAKDTGDTAIQDLSNAIELHSKHMSNTAGRLTPADQRTQSEIQRLMSSSLAAMKDDEAGEDESDDMPAATAPAGKKMFPKSGA